MSEECLAVVNINQDLCSRCSVCYSICPYDAIKLDPESDEVAIDIQECQVCGICSSACPVAAIEMAYYDYDHLLDYVECAKKKEPPVQAPSENCAIFTEGRLVPRVACPRFMYQRL